MPTHRRLGRKAMILTGQQEEQYRAGLISYLFMILTDVICHRRLWSYDLMLVKGFHAHFTGFI